MMLVMASLGEGRNPLGVRARLWLAHLLGGVVGGTGAVLALWLLASPLRTMLPELFSLALVFALLVAGSARDLGLLEFPKLGRQVPATWLARYGPARSFAFFGVFLGSGLLTHVPYAITYGVFGAAALTLPLPHALLAGAAFGIGRTVLVGPASFAIEPASRILYRSAAARRILPWLSGAVCLLLATSAVTSRIAGLV
jgi:hypothetical protein